MPISSFFGMQTSLRGLIAQQRLLDTTSHNIANVNTPGYRRLEVLFEQSLAQALQAPGSAVDGTAAMNLSDGEAGGTQMDWQADVNISGTLASVGARLIEGTANKMIGQTFDCIRTKLEA